jgi:hypothetical protein
MKRRNHRLALSIFLVFLLLTLPATSNGMAAPNETQDPVIAASPADKPAGMLLQDSSLTRIQFDRGATSKVVSGDLAANAKVRYILRALSWQLMDVTLTAPEGVKLSVTTASGRRVTPLASSSTGFRGYLPRDGDYIIEVAAGSQAASYSINVSIPKRISFARGRTSATLEGRVNPHQSLDYILRARAGQLMEISVSPESSVQLIIYGVDGTVLRSGMGEGSSFRGELPVSQDYFVTVRAGTEAVSYTLSAIIPQRIRFQPGAISASVRGSLPSSQSQYYVLRAKKDQTMQVQVTPSEAVQLIIYGADGTVLRSGMGEGASFSGKLPSSQDYVVVVRTGSKAAAYRLDVTIR